MLHKALEQFLTDVFWDDPDFLLVDLPPGHRRHLPLAGAVPARGPRSTSSPPRSRPPSRSPSAPAFMAQKVNLEVKGVIENMSWFTGDDGKRYELFGAGGGDELAERARRAAARARCRSSPSCAAGGDAGRPIVLTEPDGDAAAGLRSHRRADRGGAGPHPPLPQGAEAPLARRGGGRHPRRAVAPVPSSWWTRRPAPRSPSRPEDRPVGRRAVLGMLGLGGAGILWGAKVQQRMEEALRPLTVNDQTACRRSSRRPGGSASTRSPARCPAAATTTTASRVDGAVDRPIDARPRRPARAAARRPALTRDFQCVTGWRVADVPWRGVKLPDLLDRRRRAGRRHARALLVLRRRLHRDAHARAGPARRRPRRPPDARQAGHRASTAVRCASTWRRCTATSRSSGSSASRWSTPSTSPPTLATGSASATTSTRGSGARTASTTRRRRDRRRPPTPRSSPSGDVVRFDRAERWLHWSNATLVPRAARHRHDAVRPGAVAAWSAAGCW